MQIYTDIVSSDYDDVSDCSQSTPNPPVFFVPKTSSTANIQVYFRQNLNMEANNMNPDQTAPLEQSVLGSYCLQYRLLRIIKDNKSCDGLEKG